MGVATGCGCKEYIDFLILLIPTPLVSVLFTAASLLFVHFLKCFSFFTLYYILSYSNRLHEILAMCANCCLELFYKHSNLLANEVTYPEVMLCNILIKYS